MGFYCIKFSSTGPMGIETCPALSPGRHMKQRAFGQEMVFDPDKSMHEAGGISCFESS